MLSSSGVFAEANKKMEKIPSISIEDFSKVEMKTGKVIAAEAIPKSSKLLKLQGGYRRGDPADCEWHCAIL